MRRILLAACSLFLAAATLSAQRNLYVIDNVTVDNFDGSQLKGKIIQDYQLSTSGSGKNAITVHSITTLGNGSRFSVPQLRLRSMEDLSSGLKNLDQLMGTIKDSTFLTSGGNRVTLYDDSEKVLYVIDGRKCNDNTAFKQLRPTQIESITILKAGTGRKQYDTDLPVIVVKTKQPDASLIEWLKKQPGTAVQADGTVRINGESVNSVIVNGQTFPVKSTQ